MAETDEGASPTETDQLGTMDLTETCLNHAFSDRVLIRSIVGRPDGGAGLAGKRVRAGGWVKTGREQGKGTLAFLELNDGSCPASLQVVVDAGVAPVLKKLVATGTCVVVDGILKVPPPPPQGQGTRPQRIELGVEKVVHIGEVNPAKYPIPKRNPTLEFLRDHLHLRSRTNTIAAIARIRNALAFATHSFFQDHHFLYVQTPIITTSDCEGAGEMFQVTTLINEADHKLDKELIKIKKDGKIDYTQDFFARQAFLTVSGQLQVETYACGLSNVYTFGPTFRAEHSHTSRHLAEFWMVEPEIAFADLKDAMTCAEAYVKYLCKWLLEKCLDDMEFMDDGCRHPISSEHERYLTEVKFQKPVIVYNYPKGIKAFYMRLNDDLETVAAMDVLVPKVGELIGGSQREERYEVIRERILEMGMPLEPYEWYLDLRRYGTVKHCGFGLGFERMILFATGIDNIRDVIPFPRYPGRADL
ncbi:Aminoacyl-tRNA synthetase, class II (D/K/N) [Corchorus olitorius]|uniref:Aminoacyl-tRNA synthetase, class II (D/K/N) n=1 Tax=Corchorus olitorius TaxID=93759 RepID=A0A1R3H6H6_9ROSI|nr:Aminoacyl-tRNA synthetase, class II (D/K/N) [Corchorus olitorius]